MRDIIELCHRDDVLVSTAGFLERALPRGVDRCLDAGRACCFDVIEVSQGWSRMKILLAIDGSAPSHNAIEEVAHQ